MRRGLASYGLAPAVGQGGRPRNNISIFQGSKSINVNIQKAS